MVISCPSPPKKIALQIAQRQQYVCPVCGESLLNDEELHLHHKKPKSQGGGDNYGNLQLVHLYCHQQIHSGTISSCDLLEPDAL
ncbi:HNH endonuclease [Anabaena sp. WFMT]|uniref:HNH endonuclease n=1 Tax=Anabaena sp. WFMT TaxID=3449730 RepID=UPI003F28F85F